MDSVKEEKKVNRQKSSFHEGLTVVRLSLEWYKDQFHKTLRCLLVSGLANILLVIVVAALLIARPSPQYFAITPDLRVMEMAPLSEPYIQSAGLTTWVAQTVTETFSLNFRTWREQLGSVRGAYDPKAFETLAVALKSNGILDIIDSKRLICSVIMQTAPVIYASGTQQGVYMWRVKVPLQLNYESSHGVVHRQNLLADILIQRADTMQFPSGINIRQIVLSTNTTAKP